MGARRGEDGRTGGREDGRTGAAAAETRGGVDGSAAPPPPPAPPSPSPPLPPSSAPPILHQPESYRRCEPPPRSRRRPLDRPLPLNLPSEHRSARTGPGGRGCPRESPEPVGTLRINQNRGQISYLGEVGGLRTDDLRGPSLLGGHGRGAGQRSLRQRNLRHRRTSGSERGFERHFQATGGPASGETTYRAQHCDETYVNWIRGGEASMYAMKGKAFYPQRILRLTGWEGWTGRTHWSSVASSPSTLDTRVHAHGDGPLSHTPLFTRSLAHSLVRSFAPPLPPPPSPSSLAPPSSPPLPSP